MSRTNSQSSKSQHWIDTIRSELQKLQSSNLPPEQHYIELHHIVANSTEASFAAHAFDRFIDACDNQTYDGFHVSIRNNNVCGTICLVFDWMNATSGTALPLKQVRDKYLEALYHVANHDRHALLMDALPLVRKAILSESSIQSFKDRARNGHEFATFMDVYNIGQVLCGHGARLFPREFMSMFSERYPDVGGFHVLCNLASPTITVRWDDDFESVSIGTRQCATMLNRIDDQEATLAASGVPRHQIVYIVRNGPDDNDELDTIGKLCVNREDAYYHCRMAVSSEGSLNEVNCCMMFMQKMVETFPHSSACLHLHQAKSIGKNLRKN